MTKNTLATDSNRCIATTMTARTTMILSSRSFRLIVWKRGMRSIMGSVQNLKREVQQQVVLIVIIIHWWTAERVS